MPTVSTKWDIRSLIEHYAHVKVVSSAVVHGVREYHSNCPFPGCEGSTDSFIMCPDTGRYSHSIRAKGCGKSGDGIDFLEDYMMMDRREAMEELELQDVSFYDNKPVIPQQQDGKSAPNKKWQEAGLLIVERAERYLWHSSAPESVKALAYLHARGLKDETIKKARIGYCPLMPDGRWYMGTFEQWGLDPEQLTESQLAKGGVKVPNGIVIPWFCNNQLWKIAVKRPGQEMDYGQVMGSSEGLYNVDAIQYGELVMMVEGEIDALSVIQEAGDLVNCVATGSAGKGRLGKWIAEIGLASFILQSFDEDEAGDSGAEFWLKLFEKICIRWTPGLWKDVNEMLQKQLSGENDVCTLRQWVQYGIDSATIDFSASRQLINAIGNTVEVAQAEDDLTAIEDELMQEQESIQNPEKDQELSKPDPLQGFASTISKIVDVLGGPDRVTIQKYDPSMKPVRKSEPYKPVTLPALPRAKCPHIVIGSKRISDEISAPTKALCREPVQSDGWCAYHQPSQELLELLALYNYPEAHLGARWIGAGVACAEAYAELVTPEHARQDIVRIKARYE